MLNRNSYKIIELLLLFFVLPASLALTIPPVLKVIFVLTGVIYCILVTVKLKLITKKEFYELHLSNHWKSIALSFLVIIVASSVFMYIRDRGNLFIVVRENPLLWLFILFFYTVFSAYPQELLYRSYFFKRYGQIFNNPVYLLALNILAFPVAHLMFRNLLVLLVTFIGGILFTLTYYRSRSVMLTSIEHAIYGNWLFTVGMGAMLAFPMPN